MLKWTEVHQKAFKDIKKVMAKVAIPSHLNFNEIFEIHAAMRTGCSHFSKWETISILQ